jgi:integrase
MGSTRQAVTHKGARVEGLWQRRTADDELRFDAVTNVNGKVVRRVLAASTISDAIRERQALLVELRVDRRRGPSDSVTFKQARLAYVEHLELLAGTGERSERSATAASARLKRLTRLDPLKLDAIGSPELAGAVRDLRAAKYAAWSIKTTMQAFSACWTFSAREHGWCSEAARPILTTPVQITRENARQARRLNEGQVHDLVHGATKAGRPLVAVIAYTGLRLGEVLALRWQNVDLVDGVIDVEFQMDEDGRPTERLKAESSRRQVPIPGALSAILTEHLAADLEVDRGREGDFVLLSARGFAYTKRRAHALFQKAVKRAKLGGVRPHDLRHSYGSILLDKGVPLPAVSRLLGHANVQTTARIYAGILEGREQRTINLVNRAFSVESGDHEVTTEDAATSTEATENPDMQGVR